MGVLTSGMTYSFALVVSNDKGLRHYRTRPYYVPEDEALIAGVLTQIVRSLSISFCCTRG